MKGVIWRKLKVVILDATKIFAVAVLGFATYGIAVTQHPWFEVVTLSAIYFASAFTGFMLIHLFTLAGLLVHFWILWRFRRFSRYTIERTYADGTKKRYVLTMPRWVDNLAFEDQKRVIFAQVKGQ